MKLLVYSHYFAPSIGGVETIVLSLAQGLADLRTSTNARQFEVTLVTQTPTGDFDDRTLSFRLIRRPGLLRLWRLVRACDVIHVAGPALTPLVLARLSRKPAVVEHHGYQAICPNGQLIHQPDVSICPGHFQAKRYAECFRCESVRVGSLSSVFGLASMFLRYWLSRGAAQNVAVTRYVMQRQALPQSSVILHGIEPITSSDSLTMASASPLERVCFGYVGRFVPEKGISTLLQAARMLREEGRDFDVRLVGDGPERTKLERIIDGEHLEKYVRITGYLRGAALAEAVRGIHVMVMPSIWEETAGLAAMEQMMRGRLVIASDVGGLAEVVGDTGLKCTPGRADALAECMRKVLLDTSIVDVLGKKARERALQLFMRARMVDKHADVYRKCFARAQQDV